MKQTDHSNQGEPCKNVFAGMATMQGREKECRNAYMSLSGQVERVGVHRRPYGKRTDDARKFLSQPHEGYFLTCDDDLIYPPGYAKYMVDALEVQRKQRGPCVISLAGRILHGEISSYYKDMKNQTLIDWRSADGMTRRIDIPGTGVMAYNVDDVKVSMDDFPHENMADIQMGLLCYRIGVPVVRVPPPRKDWISYQKVKDTIWDRYRYDHDTQTRVANMLMSGIEQKVNDYE